MKKPDVSVLIPVYNAEKFIINTLSKLSTQTLSNIEIVCVDDGSQDASYQLIDDFKKNNITNIKLISQKNLGVGGALKTAANHANGDYVVPIGHDDWLSDDALEKAYHEAIASDSQAVMFDLFSDSANSEQHRLIDLDKFEYPMDGLTALKKSLGAWEVHGYALYEKNRYVSCYNSFDTKLYNADEVATRILLYKANRVSKTDGRYYNFDMPGSLTKTFTIKRFNFLDAQIEIFNFLKKEDILNETGMGWALDTLKWYRDLYKFLYEFKDQISESDYKNLETKLTDTLRAIPKQHLTEIIRNKSYKPKFRGQALLALTRIMPVFIKY